MDTITFMILAGAVASTFAGPAVVFYIGLTRDKAASQSPRHTAGNGVTANARESRPRSDASKRLVGSLLLSALAFNLMFLAQELFLVLPKAATPGLHPILYHNNHGWTGDNPIAELLQGTGALGLFLLSLALFALLRATNPKGFLLRAFLLWLVFHGVFQSVPQVVVGSVLPGNDVGRAFAYLGLPPLAKLIASAAAIAVIIWFGLALRPDFLALARDTSQIATPRARTAFIFRTATVPLAGSLPLIFMSREPGSFDQVYIVPIAVAIIGIGWLQAGAWAETRATPRAVRPVSHIFLPAAALIVLFTVFHTLLAPGVRF